MKGEVGQRTGGEDDGHGSEACEGLEGVGGAVRQTPGCVASASHPARVGGRAPCVWERHTGGRHVAVSRVVGLDEVTGVSEGKGVARTQQRGGDTPSPTIRQTRGQDWSCSVKSSSACFVSLRLGKESRRKLTRTA